MSTVLALPEPPSAIGFRRAAPGEAAAIVAMHRRSLSALGAQHYTPAEIDRLFASHRTVDEAMLAGGTYILACAGGRIVGSGGWTLRAPRPGDAGPSARLRGIFVDPDHARQGIARRIVEAAESEAVLIGGAVEIDLQATRTGVPFYRRLGYAQEAADPLPLDGGGSFEAWHMVKRVLARPEAEAA